MSNMFAQPESPAAINVEFRASLPQRVFDGLFALAVCIIAAVMGSVLMFLIISPLTRRAWPVGATVAVSAGLSVLMALIGLALVRRRPSRIALSERGLRATGFLYRRACPYEDVTLVMLQRPENTIGRACQVIVRRRSGPSIAIWLGRADAEECFDTLRRMCEQAPAIDLEASVLAPEDPMHRRAGLLVAAGEFRRRSRRNALVAGLLAVLSVSAILSLVSYYSGASTSTRSVSRRWFSAVFFPVAAAGAGLACRSNRRAARELERDAQGVWSVGAGDDERAESV